MGYAKAEGTIELAGRHFAPYIPAETINERTDALAEQILADYGGRSIHAIHIALGGIFWGSDLTRAIRRRQPDAQLTHDLLRLGSYGQGMASSGSLRQFGYLGNPELIEGNNVIVIDEVVDSGLTLSYMVKLFEYGIPANGSADARLLRPASFALAVLTDKATVHDGRVKVNYAGFEVPKAWLVGRGMDHKEQGRELQTIYRSAMPGEPEPAPFTIPLTISPFGSRAAA